MLRKNLSYGKIITTGKCQKKLKNYLEIGKHGLGTVFPSVSHVIFR